MDGDSVETQYDVLQVGGSVPFHGAATITITVQRKSTRFADDDVHGGEITRKKREDPGMLYSGCSFQIFVFWQRTARARVFASSS